jgi:hypothetical protein
MTRTIKILTLVAVSSCCVAVSLFVAYRIAEVFFFDKFFYRKSVVYGYLHNAEWDALKSQSKNPEIINKRIADLIDLTSSSKVLGAETPEHVYKIALIGDSYVYGSGIKNDERYGVVLERELNKIRPTKVYELGLPGDDLINNYAKYLLAKDKINPDLYILTLIDNDLLFNKNGKYPHETDLYNQFKSVCPQPLFDKPMLDITLTWQKQTTDYYYPSFSKEYANRCILEEIAKTISPEKLMVFAYYIPPTPDSLPKNETEENKDSSELMTAYINAFAKRDIPIVSVNNMKNFTWKPVSAQEGHPSAETHAFFALSLFSEITKNPKWNFSPTSGKK